VVAGAEAEWAGEPTLEQAARQHGVRVVGDQAEIRLEAVDFVISYMCRQLVRVETLALARRGAFNFHAGPLPEYGGWAFYNVAILEGAKEYGCTCHWMDESFDTGPLHDVSRFAIDAGEETAVSLERRAQQEMIRQFVGFCRRAEDGEELARVAQDPSRMRYMTKAEFERLKAVPADANPQTIDRYARAFWYPPYQCATLEVNGHAVEIVPPAAKEHLATALHRDDLDDLLAAADTQLVREATPG
jgi:methionyl-tRNA formyltransferase